MITVNNVSLSFDGTTLFSDVNLKFTPGNCYGIIGANGAGKSTFLKILSGAKEPTTGEIIIPANVRMSVLKQDHYAYDSYTVMDTVIMGNARLYEIMQQKDALYAKPDFSEEDGILASELEGEFAELNGWEAETEALQAAAGLRAAEDWHRICHDERPGRQAEGEGAAGPGAVWPAARSFCWTSRPTTWTSSPSTGWRSF